MSHVDKMEIDVQDLDALKKCVEHFGGQFNEGKKTYKWFGRHVGDYPIPEGMTKEDLGKCDHTISVPNKPGAYEVGVIKKKDGPGYHLIWDFWAGGMGLQDMIGEKGGNLIQAYAIEAAANDLQRQGYRLDRMRLPNGDMLVQVEVGR